MLDQDIKKCIHILEKMFLYRNKNPLFKDAYDELKNKFENSKEINNDNNKKSNEKCFQECYLIDFQKIRVVINYKCLNNSFDNNALKTEINRNIDDIELFIFIIFDENRYKFPNRFFLYNYVNQRLHKPCELFHYKHLSQNVNKIANELPYHEIVTDSFDPIDKKNIPLISIDDTIIKFMGGKEDDIIKITKASNVIGDKSVYRRCYKSS